MIIVSIYGQMSVFLQISGWGIMKITEYTYEEMQRFLDVMSGIYSSLRLVDPRECREVLLIGDGKISYGDSCFSVWGKQKRCSNCSSYRSGQSGQRFVKEEPYEEEFITVQSVPVRLRLDSGEVLSLVLELLMAHGEDTGAKVLYSRNAESAGEEIYADHAVTHDLLTRLYNREGFYMAVRRELAEHPVEPWLVLVVNIRHFKLLNSLFGKEKGNEVLLDISSALITKCGKGAVCGRLESDHFAVCMHKYEFNERRMSRMIRDIENRFDSSVFSLHIHMGVYEVTDRAIAVSAMCDRANLAIRSIENSSERSIAYFTEEMLSEMLNEQQVVSSFEKAIGTKQIKLFLQPVFDLDGNVVGAEARARWIKSNGETIKPDDFREILEKTELIARLDESVWELAIKLLHIWKERGRGDIQIAVKISGQDFFYIDVARSITNMVRWYGVNPENLHLDITGMAMLAGYREILKSISRLRREGFSVGIDEFGAGFTSLGILRDVKADRLRLNMDFLEGGEIGYRDEIILNSVVGLGRELGMKVLASGVENEEQRALLTEMGCNIFEGSLYADPMTANDFEKKYMRKGQSGAV